MNVKRAIKELNMLPVYKVTANQTKHCVRIFPSGWEQVRDLLSHFSTSPSVSIVEVCPLLIEIELWDWKRSPCGWVYLCNLEGYYCLRVEYVRLGHLNFCTKNMKGKWGCSKFHFKVEQNLFMIRRTDNFF